MLEEDKSQFEVSKTFPLSAVKYVLDSESPVVSQGPTGPAAVTMIFFVPIFFLLLFFRTHPLSLLAHPILTARLQVFRHL